MCEKCPVGFDLTDENECFDCNAGLDDMVCKVCDYKDPDRCITCGEGYRLSVQDDYTCIPCDQTTCASCDF